MAIDIIKHVRTQMTLTEKEKAATELLKGAWNRDWNFGKIYKELEEIIGKPYNLSTLQKLKPSMFELLVAHMEN